MSAVGEPYTCECCNRGFRKTRSDEEALAEARSLWKPASEADVDAEAQAVICDDCFREFTAWAAANAPEVFR